MLWYENRVIDGRNTLVPVLLLPEGDVARYAQPNAGGNVFITADALTNTGRITAAGDATLVGGQVVNTGTVLATGSLSILAGSLFNEQLTATTVSVGQHGSYSATTLQDGGTLAGANVAITTLGDFTSVGGLIQAGDTLSIVAGGTVSILAQQTGTASDETSHHTRTRAQTGTDVGTQLIAGTGLSILGGRDVILQASHLAAPSVDLRAAGTVAFLAGHDVTATQVSGTQTDLFTQKILDHGRSDESLVYPTIDGALSVQAGGIAVEYEAGQDVRRIADQSLDQVGDGRLLTAH